MGASSCHKPRRVLAQKHKGMDVASAETMGTLLLIPPPESVRESTSKQTVELSPSGRSSQDRHLTTKAANER